MALEKIKMAVVKMLVVPKNVILKMLKSSDDKRREKKKKKLFLTQKIPKMKENKTKK